MSVPPIQWTDTVSPPAGVYVPVIRCPADGRIIVPMLDEKITGVIGHWDREARSKSGRGRWLPCTGDLCSLCARGLGHRELFWITVWLEAVSRRGLAELRDEAVRCCPQLLPARGVSLRGRALTLTRKSPGRYSPTQLFLGDLVADRNALPPGLDVKSALLRMWGFAAPLAQPPSQLPSE